MASTRRPSDGLLARVNFPLYAVEMLTSRHVLVAGGGGSSKTGVANGFEIYEIYHNGSFFCAEEVLRHETGENVVMNFAVSSDGRRAFLCAGQESHCQMYLVNSCVTNEDGSDPITADNDDKIPTGKENGLRCRKNTNTTGNTTAANEELPNGHANNGATGQSARSKASAEASDNLRRRLTFAIKCMDSVQTDFLNKEPLQRVVRISSNGHIMATGGTDGHLRIWSFPQMQRLADVDAHNKEIDDIDFSPDSKYIATIAKDGKGYVWDAVTSNKCYDLKFINTDEKIKFLFKRCRYGTIEAQRDQYRLYCIVNNVGKVGKQHGYLQKWDGCKKQLHLSVTHKESLASLAVRDDGRFVAIGTMFSGSIYMYIAFSLQCVLFIPDAHSMFVTGLQFLPVTNEKGPPISSDSEAAVISISVDNKVCIHSLQQRRMMPVWLAILVIVIVLYGAFALCLYIGL